MHMADALLSPAVGGTMLAAGAGAIALSVKKMGGRNFDEKKIPLMGVMGAFVFAGQMVNFTIPGAGSSGHIGGGLLLAAVLGPYAALVTLASVLLIQCLFFADGGLLAYGCNVFNMGVMACLVAYPLVYRPLTRRRLDKKSITLASVLAVCAALQLGAFCVVLETFFSGIARLPFRTFLLLMQPVHLAIGLVEGLVTAAVLCFVRSARPELLERDRPAAAGRPLKKVLIAFGVLTLAAAAGFSILASSYPDGLEWSLEKTAGSAELEAEGPAFDAAAAVVEKTAFMPDYAFKGAGEESAAGAAAETAVAGIAGSVITLLVAGGAAFAVAAFRRRAARKAAA